MAMFKKSTTDQSSTFLSQDTDAEPEGDCGLFSFTPRWLQSFNNIRVMVACQCVFAFMEGFLVNGVINVIIHPLETRYRLSSKLSGMVASANSFGALFLLLFIGHIAEQRHKPRIMAAGATCVALGATIFLMPHVLSPPYQPGQAGTANIPGSQVLNACFNESESDVSERCTDSGAVDTELQYSNEAMYGLFIAGQVLIGLGSVPMFTIGITYIDENTKPKMTSLYTGLVYCVAALGVAVGYVVAGQTLSVYVDVGRVDPEDITITPDDPGWVGAWWIGVAAPTVALVLSALPVFAFPKRLPGYNELLKSREPESHGVTDDHPAHEPRYKGTLREFPRALYRLVRNPTFVLLCLAGSCDTLIVGGLSTFGAKLFKEMFHINMISAGTFMGFITVPGAGGGMLLGGYLVKKLELKCSGIITMLAAVSAVSVCLAPAFFLRCDDVAMAGVTEHYPGVPASDPISLDAHCNSHCACSTEVMEPLCVNGHVTYFSPCHAGCEKGDIGAHKKFTTCSCIRNSLNETMLKSDAGLNNNSSAWLPTHGPDIKSGSCAQSCSLVYVFSAFCFLFMLVTFSTLTPNITAVIRCVRHDERSLAVSLQLLTGRLLGTTPAPVLIGALLDSTCSVWQDGCQVTGACWLYDRTALSHRLVIWWACLKIGALVLYMLALRIYRPPESDTKPMATSTL